MEMKTKIYFIYLIVIVVTFDLGGKQNVKWFIILNYEN